MSVLPKLRYLCSSWHIRPNMEITARIIGTSDMVMILWRSNVAIKDLNGHLGAAPQTLQVALEAVGNLLPDLMFPLHHIKWPSIINDQGAAELVIEIKWIN